jgi:hypothetical protein
MASKRILTDYSEMVAVGEDDHGDIRLSLYRVLPGEPATRTDEVVLRPSQAERLAAELLAYANGDHKLPPDAIRPQRIAVPPETPGSFEDDVTKGVLALDKFFGHKTSPTSEELVRAVLSAVRRETL